MDKNKSIDGLKHRASRKTVTVEPQKGIKKATPKTTAKKVVAKNTTTKKVVSKKPVAQKSTPKKPIKKPAAKKPITKKPVNTAASTQVNSPVEDFLAPVKAFDFDEQSGKLTSIKPSDKLKTKKKGKKMSKKKKASIGVIILLSLLLIGLIWFVIWGNDIIAKITSGQGNVFSLLFPDDNYVELKTGENGRTNILAFGTSGYNMQGDGNGGVHDGAALTDSIMIISLDQENGDIAMLSLPRDLKATPTCTATGKINEVYWCNNMDNDNEKAGAEALMTAVSDVLGLDFQYYAHLNWGSLISIVDTLGGIKVTLDEDIMDYYYTGAVYEAGKEYTLTGAEAMGLSRARHGTADGDFSRGASQQKILIGIKDRVLEKGLSITDMISLAGTLGDNLRTNFSIEELKSAAHLLQTFDFNNIRQISLLEPERLMIPANINSISYVIPTSGVGNYYDIQTYIDKAFSKDPKIYEEPSILVLNNTEEDNLASTEKTNLEQDGFTNIEIDNTSVEDQSDKYSLFALTNKKPMTTKLLEKKYNTSAQSTENLPAGIPTDYDFVLLINQ